MSTPDFKPWRVEDPGADNLAIYAGDRRIAGKIPQEDRANAWLIAAAPDLYAVLREAREWILGEGSVVPERLVGRISAALAKAEGR